MTQENLFTQDTPVIQIGDPKKAQANRQQTIDATLKKQGEVFKAQYRVYAIKFAQENDTFLAEDIRFAYEKTANTQPTNWKASGGVIQQLVKKGVLIQTGEYRYCKSGSRKMAVYRYGR